LTRQNNAKKHINTESVPNFDIDLNFMMNIMCC
jgi:hypothetical protein